MNTLSEIYGEGKVLLSKYPEPGRDSEHNEAFDFYAGTYPEEIIYTEEARILPSIGNDIKVLINSDTLDQSLINYYNYTYPNTFSSKNLIPYSLNNYYKIIKEFVKEKTLVVLHPYHNIDNSKYYIDPKIIFDINDKTNLSKLSLDIPNHVILSLNEIKDLDSYPFVIKTNSGASGDGVRIIYNKENLDKALNYFKEEKELMIEEYIDEINNFNVQLTISQNGEISLMGVSKQFTTKKGEYDGNLILKDINLPAKALIICMDACKNAYKQGFYGVCGLDILENDSGNFFLIDPNFRINGSTSSLLIKDQLYCETDSNVLKFGSFKSNHVDIKTMLEDHKNLGEKSFYILSAFKNKISGILHGYGISYGEDETEINYKSKALERTNFIF